jgi:hypothetical protein
MKHMHLFMICLFFLVGCGTQTETGEQQTVTLTTADGSASKAKITVDRVHVSATANYKEFIILGVSLYYTNLGSTLVSWKPTEFAVMSADKVYRGTWHVEEIGSYPEPRNIIEHGANVYQSMRVINGGSIHDGPTSRTWSIYNCKPDEKAYASILFEIPGNSLNADMYFGILATDGKTFLEKTLIYDKSRSAYDFAIGSEDFKTSVWSKQTISRDNRY